MLKTCFLALSALAACMSGFAAPSAQSSSAPVTAGIITSSSAYDQTNPDGSVTKMLMMVIKKPDGSSVIKTEALPTTITRDSQGRLVTSFTIPNEKMAVVDPLASAPTPSVPNKIDELIAQRGPPLSVAKGARKAIYRWADLEVTVVDGLVTQSRERNLDVERNDEAQRAYRAAAERQRLLQEQQARMSAMASTPSTAVSSNSSAYAPRAGPSKEERIAEVRLEIEECHRTIDLHFKEVSTPFNARRVSPAMLELAEAQLARLEQELIDLQAP